MLVDRLERPANECMLDGHRGSRVRTERDRDVRKSELISAHIRLSVDH